METKWKKWRIGVVPRKQGKKEIGHPRQTREGETEILVEMKLDLIDSGLAGWRQLHRKSTEQWTRIGV